MDRPTRSLPQWLGASASRRAGIGGLAASILGIGLGGAAASAQTDSQKRGKPSRTVKISGTETFNATPQAIYDFVTNPESGAACSAAVDNLTSQSGGKFTVKVAYKKGAFNPSGTVEGAFSNMVNGKSGRLSGTGMAAGGGRLEHNLEFALNPVPGLMATEVSYNAEVVFMGMLGGFRQKFLEKQVDTVASKFVRCAREKNGW